jgi:hypothetical protein
MRAFHCPAGASQGICTARENHRNGTGSARALPDLRAHPHLKGTPSSPQMVRATPAKAKRFNLRTGQSLLAGSGKHSMA